MNENLCCTCKWWTEYTNFCTNGDSKKRAEFTDYDETCEEWEAKE